MIFWLMTAGTQLFDGEYVSGPKERLLEFSILICGSRGCLTCRLELSNVL